MLKYAFTLLCIITISFCCAQTFRVSIEPGLHQPVLDGRLLLLLADNDHAEPRFQIDDDAHTQLVFGTDAENWQPGTSQLIDTRAFGYPLERLKDIPAGDYYVQVLLHKYETFHLKTGQTVKLPMDRGEGQHWNTAPGNIYSAPVKIHFDPTATNEISLTISQIIPAIKEPVDSKYIKHIRIQSKLLSEFWGRPMYLGAHILLPEGFDTHPSVKYPLAIFHGHFPEDFDGFRTVAPDANIPYDTNTRFRIINYNKIVQE